MAFLLDAQELKNGLVLFRRSDVAHRRWYCRIKLPKEDRYKTVSLKTADLETARERAFEQDAELRTMLKHDVPIFNKSFAQVAKEFLDFQKARSEAGEITRHRWRVLDSHIRSQLEPYVGTVQITLIGEDRWKSYPSHRQKTGKGRSGGAVSDGTIRDEMASRRSTYCFRHTYATYRLMEGVDVYFLAKQMGTSVKMIEDHYGHITPVKNAERILQGMPGWEPIAAKAGKETGA